MATLLGSGHTTPVEMVGVAALAVMGTLAFVPEVADWLTGPYSANQGEPSSVVAARALIGWSTFLAGLGALAFLIISTSGGGKPQIFLGPAAGAGLLTSSIGALAGGDAAVRIRASVGAGLVLLATLIAASSRWARSPWPARPWPRWCSFR